MYKKISISAVLLIAFSTSIVAEAESKYVFEAGDKSLKVWLLPKEAPHPVDNQPTADRVELGKKLFFDPRLSGDQNMSCATCHSPLFGWSDGLSTAKGNKSAVLGRASPTIVNSAYEKIFMWDGRKASLEDQAMGPMQAAAEMNMNIPSLIKFLNTNPEYLAAFQKAYPNEGINETTLSKAITSFERTVISNNSPFDRWVKGEKKALSESQVRGFKVFVDPAKGNCEVCHSAPNFTDGGFNNIGLASFGDAHPDVGRFSEKPIKSMKGAFKTPTLRDITLTAPYFHDGSAATLEAVVDHYVKGGEVKTNLSPNLKPLNLTDEEKSDLAAFMRSLTTPAKPFLLPVLPI